MTSLGVKLILAQVRRNNLSKRPWSKMKSKKILLEEPYSTLKQKSGDTNKTLGRELYSTVLIQ